MMITPTWFLETSVQINRFFGHSLFKKEIEKVIGKLVCYTSLFVFYEYKRRVIKTLIELYYHILEEDNPADAIAYYKENFSNRENKIVIGAISELLRESSLANNKLKFKKRMEVFIRAKAQIFLDTIYGFIDDQIKCPLAEVSLDDGYDKLVGNIKCKAQCSAANFWKKHRNILEILTNDELNKPHLKNKGFSKVLPLLHQLLDNPEIGQTCENCLKLADTIIAIEMPEDYTMLTFDKSFESLCSLMGKEYKILPSLAELKKRYANTSSPIDDMLND